MTPDEQPPWNRRESPARGDAPRRRPQRWIAAAVFAAIAVIILADRVPALRFAIESFVAPARYQARAACHEAALAVAAQPAFGRLVEPGTVHATQGGFYVEGVVVGQMGEDGAEVRYGFSCYADRDGKLVTSRREPPVTGP